jgi:hypothetical protein
MKQQNPVAINPNKIVQKQALAVRQNEKLHPELSSKVTVTWSYVQ